MKTAFVILALAAACVAKNATVMYDAGIVEDIDVPKEGWWHGTFSISLVDIGYLTAVPSGARVEFTVDPTLFDVAKQRSLDFYATPFETDAPNSTYKIETFEYGTKSAIVNVSTMMDCSAGCTVYFHLYANCKLETCINSLTTDMWARIMLTTSNTYLYSTTAGAAHHVVLYENVKTMEFDVSASEIQYFQYTPATAVDLPLLVDSGVFDEITVIGSTTLNEPNESSLDWVQTKSKLTRSWPASKTAIGIVGSTKIGSTASYQLCIGADCSAAPALVAAFASLIAAFLVQLF